MLEWDDELHTIKKEIQESRGLVIRTNQLTNSLGADLKAIAKRQETYERQLQWNSATAYVLFVLVIFVALKFAWDARVDQIRSETDRQRVELTHLREELRSSQQRDAERAEAEAKAGGLYELWRHGRRTEFLDGYRTLKKESLSKAEQGFFADAAERARYELCSQLYQLGLEKLRAQRPSEAVAALEDALRYKDDASTSANLRFALAQAYRKAGRHKEAIPLLQQLADGPSDKDYHDDALAELGRAQADIQLWNDAKATWRTLLRRFPESHFAGEARLELGDLNLKH